MEQPLLPQSEFQRDAGRRLKHLIEMLDISLVEAARLMGVSKHVLNHWMVGNNPIQPYGLYRLCRAKRVDFNYVFLEDWSRLPHELGRKVEAELQASLEAALGKEPQEAGKIDMPSGTE